MSPRVRLDTNLAHVTIAASGVGQTNTLTAVANAQVNCWPLLLIGGSAELRRRNMGDFQELAQVSSTEPFCKWADGASTMDISRQVVPVWNPRQRVDAGVAGCVGVGVPPWKEPSTRARLRW